MVLRFYCWKPLNRQSGPFQRVCDHQVVQEGRVFLPYLVFLIDDLFLQNSIVVYTRRERDTGEQSSRWGKGLRDPWVSILSLPAPAGDAERVPFEDGFPD
jgi:hypothetical protein